jgi:hypothetical protein
MPVKATFGRADRRGMSDAPPPGDNPQGNEPPPYSPPPAGPPPSGPPPGYGPPPAHNAPPPYGAPGYGAPGYGAPGYGAQYGGPKPSNYLVQAILTTLFCCLPVGIVSIVFAAQVDSKWNAGDHQGAQNASRQARTWAWVSFGLGLTVGLIYLIAIIALAGSDSTTFQDPQYTP